MGHENWTGISLKGPDENDALTGWRKVTRFRPGKRKEAKTAFNRRVRRRPIEADEAAFEDKVRGVATAPVPEDNSNQPD